MKDIKDGWAFDQCSGSVYSFEHFPISQAEEMAHARDSVHLVETINFTYAENEKTVHHNKYFALNMPSAIALAARMEIDWQDVAEEVVSIRTATEEENRLFLKVSEYFDERMPDAISDTQASQLQQPGKQGPIR